MTRAYHGDWIQEKKFKRHYLPASLPKLSIQPHQKINKSNSQESKVPLAAMMYTEVERRIDVVLFRSCFADSIYEARRMVLHDAVKLNGVRVCHSFSQVWSLCSITHMIQFSVLLLGPDFILEI